MAWSRSAACSCRRMAPGSSRSAVSVMEHPAALDRLDDLGYRRVADEDLEGDDQLAGRAGPGPLRQTGVADDHVGVAGNGGDRGVLDLDRVLLELLAELAGEHDAAAPAGVAGADPLGDVAPIDGGGLAGPSVALWARGRGRG